MIICDVGNKKKTCILKRMSFFIVVIGELSFPSNCTA